MYLAKSPIASGNLPVSGVTSNTAVFSDRFNISKVRTFSRCVGWLIGLSRLQPETLSGTMQIL
jgi:hypothetical protein